MRILIFSSVQVTLVTFATLHAGRRAEVFAEMSVSFAPFRVVSGFTYVLPAQVAHAIPADAGQLVAARGLDETRPAAWTCSFDGRGARGFDGFAKREDQGLVAYVRIVPGLEALEA